MDRDWVLLTRVPTLVQRGALEARLQEAQIEAYIPERDAITQVSEMPNLSLQGYSALFEGYSVFVERNQWTQAQKVLEEFEKITHAHGENRKIDYLNKFYLASLMSWIFPVILHGVALYNFRKALNERPFQFSWPRMLFSWLVWLCSAYWGLYLIQDALRALGWW